MSNDKSVAKVFDVTKERFDKMAPPAIRYEAERGFAMQLLMANPNLMKVAENNHASLAQAITNVAAIGLSLNPAKKEAYLLSRNAKVKDNNGKDVWINKIVLEPSYMGLCKISTDSGVIEWVQANAAYANDMEFTDNGPGLRVTHKYDAFAKTEDRGELVGVYCTAKTTRGDYLIEIMRIDEIKDIMERSESVKYFRKNNYGQSPWFTDFMQQAYKTVIRRAYKLWPKSDGSDRADIAVQLSNENEGFEPIVSSPEVSTFTADQKNYFDQLIEKGNALGMYVFAQSFNLTDGSGDGASIWISLMHSFERGKKGKYGEIVRNLRETGDGIFTDYLSEIEASLGNADETVEQLIEELDNDTIKLIESRLIPELRMEFTKFNP